MPLFSIIVPVYNVELYLKRCVESILSQTFKDFELILIDDGSPDKCPYICDEYANQDRRIIVIHQRNSGLSAARNKGLAIAKGNYIVFVDSDDYWYNSTGLEKLANRIETFQEDVILYGGISKDENTGKEKMFRGDYNLNIFNQHNKSLTINYLSNKKKYPGSAWIFTTKRNIIKSHQILFPLNVTGEDYYWETTILYHANSIGAINEIIYVYIVNRKNSITSVSRLSGINGIHYAIQNWLSMPDYSKWSGITEFLCYAYTISLYNYAGLNKKKQKKGKELLKQDMIILKSPNKIIYEILYYLLNSIGFKFISKCIKFLHNIFLNIHA